MKNPFKKLEFAVKNIKKPSVQLSFSSCGKVLIDQLVYSFSIKSDDLPSDKGLVVSFSGDAINSGSLKLNTIDVFIRNGNKTRKITRKLEYKTKKDGKNIFTAKFTDIKITQNIKAKGFSRKKDSEQNFVDNMNSDISFKVKPTYKATDEQEVMITVYPLENVLTGSAVIWKDCTSDVDYFLHKLNK